MLSIRGVFEVAIRVRELARSEAFYCNVLGLTPGFRDQKRKWLFLWVGDRAGMVVLQEAPDTWVAQHFAFTVDEAELQRAASVLRSQGITAEGPVELEWMDAKSLYFSDPDGHDLELCAPIAKAT